MRWSSLFAIPAMLVLILIQMTYLGTATIGGVGLQLIPVLVIAWAISPVNMTPDAALIAFLGGLLIDAFSNAPLGTSAIALLIAILAVAPLRAIFKNSRILFPFVFSILALLIYTLVNFLILRINGFVITNQLFTSAIPSILLHALLIQPLFWLFSGIGSIGQPRSQVEI